MVNGEPVKINLTEVAGILFDAPNEVSGGIPLIKRKSWAIDLDAKGELDLEEKEAEMLKACFENHPNLKGSVIEGLRACFE